MDEMVKKGLDWAERLQTKPLQPWDSWLSFQLQLIPSMTLGLVPVILSPVAMEKKFQYLYFKTILLMRVKRHRTKEWREDAKFCCAGICLPGTFSSMFLGIREFHWPHDVTSV